jgi:ribonuclease P protein component
VSPSAPRGRFPRQARILKHSDFQLIQSKGQRVSTTHFVLIMRASEAVSAPTRLGVTASRKIGDAVRRNRAKRLIREAFRATRELFPAGLDLVVIVKRSLGDIRLAGVVSEWNAVRAQIERRGRTALERGNEREALAKPG